MPRSALIASVYAVLITVIVSSIAHAQTGDPVAKPQWTEADLEKGYVVFEHSAMENLLPAHVPADGAMVDTVSCTLARGEYEPLQIGVHALAEGLTNIRVEVASDLEVTVYHRIDPDTKEQSGADPGGIPTWMGSEVYLQRGDAVADLPEGTSVNFCLLFRAERGTRSGVHEGTIRVMPEGRPATELALQVRVRPFRLAAPRAAFGMYFREDFLPARFGSWSVEDRAASAIYRDMAAHGQNSVSFYMMGDFTQLPPQGSRPVEKSLGLAREAGLVHPQIPCITLQGNIPNLARTQVDAARAAVEWLEAERHKRRWPELMLYGWDEPQYPAPGLRETYVPMRAVPGRVVTAMNATGAFEYGDVHDVWIVEGGHITSEMQAEAERLGAEVWTYSYRILREGYIPLRQRYFAGLYTWARRLGGNYVWAYADGHHSHAWWEPGSDEPMPVTGWEARREGVDDYRYLQMVEDLVARKASDPFAVEAAAWLDTLRARIIATDPHTAEAGTPLDTDEYEAIRATAADYIQKLGPLSAYGGQRRPVTHLKDEAAPFRGKPVAECIAALGGPDVWQRRGAAWALYEIGPEAAEATPQLAQALDDPEVRVPALRALEAIGADAYPATPRVAALLSHPDAFVRLGATFALAGIARSETWDDGIKGYAPDSVSPSARMAVAPLRQAFGDPNGEVVMAAALGLFRCGEAAAPALPDVMGLVGEKEYAPRVGVSCVLAGMGPAAAPAVPSLAKAYADAKGEDTMVTLTLAAIGPGASEAVPMLEQYRTPENQHLADTCYALFCIRGDESDLRMLAGLLADESRPRGYAEWKDATRYLNALGAKAAPAVPLVQERLPLLKAEPALSLQRSLESTFLQRVAAGGRPMRLLPR